MVEVSMSAEDGRGRSRTSRVIVAPRDAVYAAFVDPEALVKWQAPDAMTATVHAFDGRVGGGYEMSPWYRAFVTVIPPLPSNHTGCPFAWPIIAGGGAKRIRSEVLRPVCKAGALIVRLAPHRPFGR